MGKTRADQSPAATGANTAKASGSAGQERPSKAVRQRNPLVKAFRILNWMVDTGESSWGVREVARALDMPPSTAFRTLALLEQAGVVQSDADSTRYQFTLDFYRVTSRAALAVPIRSAALPQLRALADSTGEAAYLGVYDSDRRQMMYIDGLDTRHPVQYVLTRFEWHVLHAGAGGMGVLPFLPKEVREQIVRESKLGPITDQTITSRTELRAEIDRIRAQGYAISVGRRIPGAAGVSAPVLGSDGNVIGVIVLAFPESRLPDYDAHDLGRQVAAAARKTSQELGWREPAEPN